MQSVPCPICDDAGWKTIEVDGVSRVTRCDCWHQLSFEALLKSARIPRRYLHCEFSNFERHTDSQIDAFRRAVRIMEDFPVNEKGLLLYGDNGVGKTHLAVALLRETIRRKAARGVFYETAELLKLVRNTYNSSVEATELEVLEPVLHADILVLDDLGRENKSAWVEEMLGIVINTRYNERRLTVCTSNLLDIDNTEPNSFAFQLGLRIRSRLKEMCQWVRMDGVDTRDVGPHPTANDITEWERSSPGSPKNRLTRKQQDDARARNSLPQKTGGQARAQLKTRDGKADLKWPGGRAGSQ
jgi:DNA replication protein DnaC